MSVKFIPLEDIIFIHEAIIDTIGGKVGIRDFTLLHSAVFRPQASFGGKDLYLNIFDKAGALIHSLLLNHPFIDGNKRTALASCERFLNINGIEINASQKEKVQFTLDIESKKLNLGSIANWIKIHSKKTK